MFISYHICSSGEAIVVLGETNAVNVCYVGQEQEACANIWCFKRTKAPQSLVRLTEAVGHAGAEK